MNKNSGRLAIYIAFALIFTAVATGLRTAACLYHLDYTYGYFTQKGQITAASIVFYGGIIIMLTYALWRGRVSLRASFSSPATYVPTGLVSAASLFLAVRLISEARNMAKGGTRSVLMILTLASGILAILSVLHFFYNGYVTDARNETRGYFATATVMLLACYAAMLYFRTDRAINTPNGITDQLAFLFSALFFLYEARISLGREKWGGYAVFGLIAMMATAYSSVPSLIVYFARGTSISLSLEENLYTLALFIFITARLMLAVTLPEVEKNSIVSAVEGISQKRESEVRESEQLYSERYAVQMSIDDLIPAEDMPVADVDEEEFEIPDASEFTTVFVNEDDTESGAQIEMTPDVFDVHHRVADVTDEDGGEDTESVDTEDTEEKTEDTSDEEDNGN